MKEYLPLIALLGSFAIVACGMILMGRLPEGSQDPEVRRVRLAAATLTGVVLIFLYAMSIYAAENAESAGKEIFDACVKILPPIVTLIIGYWFGTTKRKPPGPNSKG